MFGLGVSPRFALIAHENGTHDGFQYTLAQFLFVRVLRRASFLVHTPLTRDLLEWFPKLFALATFVYTLLTVPRF